MARKQPATTTKGKRQYKGEWIDSRDTYAQWSLGEYADQPDTDPKGMGVRIPANHSRAAEMAYSIHALLDRLDQMGDDLYAYERNRDLQEAEAGMQELRRALLSAHDETDMWICYGEMCRQARRVAIMQAQEAVFEWRAAHGKQQAGKKARGT